MGLIYVNPEGPNGEPDPLASARDIRETFGRMAMNDEETVALIAGGHTFGKTHGAADPEEYISHEPEAAPLEEQGLGWKSSYGTGKGADAITSGIEVTWTATPTRWSNGFFDNLFGHEWELTKSPAGANQWQPKGGTSDVTVPGPEEGSEDRLPDHADHRPGAALRPRVREDLAPLPREPRRVRGRVRARVVQADPPRHGAAGAVPRPGGPGRGADLAGPRARRQDHLRGGGGRAQAPGAGLGPVGVRAGLRRVGVGLVVPGQRQARRRQRRPRAPGAAEGWEVNDPETLGKVLSTLEGIQQSSGIGVSLADLIVLAGTAAVEKAAKDGGVDVEVGFTPGRGDATAEQTDAESFAPLEPTADGFRNYLRGEHRLPAEYLLLDRANLLTLSAPEMTVLVGGLRVLGANSGGSEVGVLTDRPGTLTNDFFVNLLDLDTEWSPSGDEFEGRDAGSGDLRWTGSRVDLVFGSNSELRALAEVYASDDAREKFVREFAAAWQKVMELDRYDLRLSRRRRCRALSARTSGRGAWRRTRPSRPRTPARARGAGPRGRRPGGS